MRSRIYRQLAYIKEDDGARYQVSAILAATTSMLAMLFLSKVNLELLAEYAILKMSFPRQILSQLDLGIAQTIFRAEAKGKRLAWRWRGFVCIAILFLVGFGVANLFLSGGYEKDLPGGYFLVLSGCAAISHLVSARERAAGKFALLTLSNFGHIGATCLFLVAVLDTSVATYCMTAVLVIEFTIATAALFWTAGVVGVRQSAADSDLFLQEFPVTMAGNAFANINGYFAHLVFASLLPAPSFALYAVVTRIKGAMTLISVTTMKVKEPKIFWELSSGEKRDPHSDLTYKKVVCLSFILAALTLIFMLSDPIGQRELSPLGAFLALAVLASEAIWRLISPLKTRATFDSNAHRQFTKYNIASNITMAVVIATLLYALDGYEFELAMLFLLALNLSFVVMTLLLNGRNNNEN